jgi:hypothetical protein
MSASLLRRWRWWWDRKYADAQAREYDEIEQRQQDADEKEIESHSERLKERLRHTRAVFPGDS